MESNDKQKNDSFIENSEKNSENLNIKDEKTIKNLFKAALTFSIISLIVMCIGWLFLLLSLKDAISLAVYLIVIIMPAFIISIVLAVVSFILSLVKKFKKLPFALSVVSLILCVAGFLFLLIR